MYSVYDQYKEQFRTGDILQWQSYSAIGKIIRWKTNVPEISKEETPNHSSMVIRLIEWEGAERRRYHTEAMERGVYPNILSARLKEFEGKVWWLPLKEEWDPKRTEIGMRLTECWGKGYDYKSLVWQLIGKVSIDARQLFCSETVDYALGFEGVAHNPVQLELLGIQRHKLLIQDSAIAQFDIP